MNICVRYENKQFENPIKYIFDVLLTTLGVHYQISHYGEAGTEVTDEDICILYGEEDTLPRARFKIHIYPSSFFGRDYLKPESMPLLPLVKVNVTGRDMPIIFRNNHGLEGGSGAVTVNEDNDKKIISTNLDIIASSFFLLSRYEEVICNKRDEHGRFPAGESLLYKEGLLCHPLVNDYMELLWRWIASFGLDIGRKPLWPDGKRFAVCLTHDIDQIKKWRLLTILGVAKKCAMLFLRQGMVSESIKKGLNIINSIVKRENPYWNFEQIIEREKEYGFSSSFYFLAGKHCLRDGDYDVSDERIQALIRWFVNSGIEVGLHGSYTSYNDGERLLKEVEALAQLCGEVHGIRQHFLRLDLQKTFAIQEEIGIKYDTTLSFAQNEGWRSSFSFPYYPWNFRENRPFTVLEIPLTIMDGTLGEARYRGLAAEEAWKVVEDILMTTEESGGCATLLWHNAYFDELTAPGFGEVYWKALKWTCEHNGWGTSGYEIYEWWCGKR